VLCSTLPNEEFLYYEEITECRKDMQNKLIEVTIELGMNIDLLCYITFLLEKLMKTDLKYCIFNR
jgi:hypothetical protein